jgi:ribonuclease HI
LKAAESFAPLTSAPSSSFSISRSHLQPPANEGHRAVTPRYTVGQVHSLLAGRVSANLGSRQSGQSNIAGENTSSVPYLNTSASFNLHPQSQTSLQKSISALQAICDHTANSSQSPASQTRPLRTARALHGLFKNALNATSANPSQARNVLVFTSADSPVASLSSCLMDKLQELDQLSDSDDDEIIPPEDFHHTMNKRLQFRNCMGTFSAPQSQETIETGDAAHPPSVSLNHHRHRRPSSFPLNIPYRPFQGPAPPPEMIFKFDCAYFTDGGFKDRYGSWAVLARAKNCSRILSGFIDENATNNVAEFTAVLHSLKHARSNSFTKIMIVTDSEIVANFLLGKSSMDKPHLADIASQIIQLLVPFQHLYVSHVPAHSKYGRMNLLTLCAPGPSPLSNH